MLISQITLAFASMFAGVALYVSAVEQPARLVLDDRGLLAQWKPSYRRAAKMQGGLVVLAGGLGLLAGWQTNDWRWIVGAAVILANGPYTLLGMLPTNKLLNGIAVEHADSTSRDLIKKWGRMHAVRTALGIAALLFFLWALN